MITVSISDDESDQQAIEAAKWALRKVGAMRRSNSWGVGGSQEIASEKWQCGGTTLTLEAETYVGLTLSGPEELVNLVAQLAADRLAASRST
jgi:hypothetical protein